MYLAQLKFQLIIALATLAIVATELMARRVRRVPLGSFAISLALTSHRARGRSHLQKFRSVVCRS